MLIFSLRINEVTQNIQFESHQLREAALHTQSWLVHQKMATTTPLNVQNYEKLRIRFDRFLNHSSLQFHMHNIIKSTYMVQLGVGTEEKKEHNIGKLQQDNTKIPL